MLYLSLQPWLDSDLAFNMTALGRENRQCVKVLHDFTNQVENLDPHFFKLLVRTLFNLMSFKGDS